MHYATLCPFFYTLNGPGFAFVCEVRLKYITFILVSWACFVFVTPLTDLKLEAYFVPKGWPVIGKLSSKFGMRQHPIRHKKIFHKGIDIALPVFSRVVVTASGKIKETGYKRDYGKYVVVDHGHGWNTLYAHLQSSSMHRGDFVKRREMIGRVGQTGLTTGPHLHYEVIYLGKPQNPLYFTTKAESAQPDFSPLASSSQTFSSHLH